MANEFSRTELLLGSEATRKLSLSRVAVFGLGGVGGYVVEALARSGVGALDIIDNDVITITNINRQIYATHGTLGRFKVDVAAERISDINPDCKVTAHRIFYTADESGLDFSQYDYAVDAIDTLAGKIAIIENANRCNTPVISCMGAGNKLDPSAFRVADIYETSVCPLAKIMRRELRKRNIEKLKVVYSREEPVRPPCDGSNRPVTGSTAFVPPVAGLIIAGEVVKDLTGIPSQKT